MSFFKLPVKTVSDEFGRKQRPASPAWIERLRNPQGVAPFPRASPVLSVAGFASSSRLIGSEPIDWRSSVMTPRLVITRCERSAMRKGLNGAGEAAVRRPL